MNTIFLMGTDDSWKRFAADELRVAGFDPVSVPDEVALETLLLDDELGRDCDLVVLSATDTRPPSALIRPIFERLGPVRILVIDGRPDFERQGDAMRAEAVAYDRRLWGREPLVKLVRTCSRQRPPDPSAIDRRFGAWRQAG